MKNKEELELYKTTADWSFYLLECLLKRIEIICQISEKKIVRLVICCNLTSFA